MIKKEQKKIIVWTMLSLFCTIYICARPSQHHSSLFSSLEDDETEFQVQTSTTGFLNNKELESFSEQKPNHNDVSTINNVQKKTINAMPEKSDNMTFDTEQPIEKPLFFETLDMPREFALDEDAVVIKDINEENTGKTEDGSPSDQEEQDDSIEFHFEDADIQNLLTQITDIFDVNFITDEILNPLNPTGKALKGNKISFKTHTPLNRHHAWNLFLTFLDLAGFALVPQPEPNMYRVVASDKAQKSPVPTFIGTAADSLPDNDQMIRFVYFIENADMNTLKDIIGTLKSPTASVILLQEIKALVITDRAYNIKSLMQIVQELDQVSMPQSMTVIKLRTADVGDVKKLYDAVSASGDGKDNGPANMFGARKQSSSIYFPENARLIAEPRTNSLIVLGSEDAIQKIEEFITKYVDVELEKPYSPLQTYQLRYANAVTVSEIMNNMSQFGSETAAGKAGGVRGGDKYLKPITFTPEPATNTIVIKGDYEDYLKVLDIIKKLDEPQPQVAIEALILTMNLENDREVGAQIRNKVPGPNGLLGNNVDFQTSGIRLGGTPRPIITNNTGPGADRLLANLINLVTNAAGGNTVVSLGADAFGVWGIFNVLQTMTNVQVVSNPFLVATNKTKAKVSVGEIRRVITSTIYAGTNQQPALGDFGAQLQLEVTPQINSDGMIVLKLNILLENFLPNSTENNVGKLTRTVDTRTIVADKEVIAIGGLVENQIRETISKVPILGDIPILGWLFRNQSKYITKNNLLILISTRIIEPEVTEYIDEHTQNKLQGYYNIVEATTDTDEYRDPVARRFFGNQTDDPTDVVENFFFERRRETYDDEPIPQNLFETLTTRDGKFYRPGGKKDAAIIMPPADIEKPSSPIMTRSFTGSSIIKDIMTEPEPVRISKKTTTPPRRRDVRRLTHLTENTIGVLT